MKFTSLISSVVLLIVSTQFVAALPVKYAVPETTTVPGLLFPLSISRTSLTSFEALDARATLGSVHMEGVFGRNVHYLQDDGAAPTSTASPGEGSFSCIVSSNTERLNCTL